ncbi:hypothetical protein U6N30_15800 [Blastococcus brunescens]|uniref:Uncharacterized protein n=1 Tax=Blastococcus brunescens TaxID=1564165 RepID=A0ABZ1BBJ9_9ACTN|nr:hypothetical protein [Blastococcus sp. BMG 8361]WRL66715.1 hypothetical protein U6N30_15800 [Blastococcus sp. BMG 8361]
MVDPLVDVVAAADLGQVLGPGVPHAAGVGVAQPVVEQRLQRGEVGTEEGLVPAVLTGQHVGHEVVGHCQQRPEVMLDTVARAGVRA